MNMDQETIIRGPKRELSWLLIMAFRYAVGRHWTEALRDIQNILVAHFPLMCDDFIRQMMDDIDFERRRQELKEDKNIDLKYLDWFYNQCLEEALRRKREKK